jgi:outer membrane murein-binding lipoprotein Lpp
MSILLGLLTQFWPYIIGAIGLGWAALKLRQSGANAERFKQAKRDAVAREERHEMDREATDAERKAAELSDAAAREEALKWRKS